MLRCRAQAHPSWWADFYWVADMLTNFKVRNFKSFQDEIELDLSAANYSFNSDCVKDGTVKTALIYGPNASGKTNLGLAIFDIIEHLTDNHSDRLPRKNILNADSEEKVCSFDYTFIFKNKKLIYSYTKDESRKIISENLKIDGKNIISYEAGSPIETKIIGAEHLKKNIEKGNNLSALKYIYSNTNLDKRNTNNKIFSEFMDFVGNMLMFRSLLAEVSYIGYIPTGRVNIFKTILENDNLSDFEKFLNGFGIKGNLVKIENDGEPTIGIKFKNKSIPFSLIASTGTISLYLFYFWWQAIRENKVSFLFIDEFDASYHFDISRQIVSRLKEIKSQVILTTHNTFLLNNDVIRPDCAFMIQESSISSLHHRTSKELRQAHNIEKMYRAGSFNE